MLRLATGHSLVTFVSRRALPSPDGVHHRPAQRTTLFCLRTTPPVNSHSRLFASKVRVRVAAKELGLVPALTNDHILPQVLLLLFMAPSSVT